MKIQVIAVGVTVGFSGGSAVKNLPSMQETQVPSLDQEDPLEKEMATHPSILDWEIPWAQVSGGYSPWCHKRVGHDLGTKQNSKSNCFY